MSIKALANKVLERNLHGNHKETQSFPDRKLEPQKFPLRKPEFPQPKEGDKLEILPLPFFDLDGSLIIPFAADKKYQWWKGGQSTKQTEEEVRQWLH